MPLMRPLFFSDETNSALIDNAQTYYWGDAFLVTPVTAPGVTSMPVDLPKGAWFDYWNGRRLEGGRKVTIPVTLETIPVLVKAGAFIPMADNMDNTRQYDSGKLQLHYYADPTVKAANGVMYDDDGKDPNALKSGRYEKLDFNARQSGKRLDFSLRRKGDFNGKPATRNIELIVHNWSGKPAAVKVDGTLQNTVVFDANAKTLRVPLAWRADSLNISIH
jgi:oligosaccharide 4-alpha-D-glucosyltransferase